MQLPVADAKKKDKNKRGYERHKEKKWLALTRLLIWHWIIYYISLVCVVCRQWNRDNVRKRQWNYKDNKGDRLISLYERATITLSLSISWYNLNDVCLISNFLFVFLLTIILMYIRTGTSLWRVYESDISYEGQMNRTQQEYNLLGQRVVCQYIYMYMYWLWITVWSEIQIGVDDSERGREEEEDKSGWMNEKQIWWSWLFILLLSEAHSLLNKVIEINKKNKRDIEVL